MSSGAPMSPQEQTEFLNELGRALADSASRSWEELRLACDCMGDYVHVSLWLIDENGSQERLTPPPDIAERIQTLRSGMYQPGKGTWVSFGYAVNKWGKCNASFNYDSEPALDPQPPDSAYAAELRRFPRAEEIIPDWLRRRAHSTASGPQGGYAQAGAPPSGPQGGYASPGTGPGYAQAAAAPYAAPPPAGGAPGYAARPTPPLADFWMRLLARLFDFWLLTTVSYISFFLIVLATTGVVAASMAGGAPPEDPPIGMLLVGFLLALGVAFLYEWIQLAVWGRTLGKYILGIRVVRVADGSKASVVQAAGRALFFSPSLFHLPNYIPLFSQLNVVWLLWDKPNRQCLHDKIAQTVVVHDRAAQPPAMPVFRDVPSQGQWSPYQPAAY